MHNVDRSLDDCRVSTGPDEDAVGHASSRTQGTWACRSNPDGHWAWVGQPSGPGRSDLDAFAVEEAADHPRAALEGRNARGAQPGEAHSGITDPQAEERPTVRNLVDGGD